MAAPAALSRKIQRRRKNYMFKNILIPTDGSDLAVKAVEQGVLFAQEIGAKITAVTVTEPFPSLPPHPSLFEFGSIEYEKHVKAHTEQVLATVSVAAERAVSSATPFVWNTRKSIRRSSMPPLREGAT
jgi:nucleotide-binding universal stress UspA family protein